MNEYLTDRYFGFNYRFCIDDAADHSSFVLNNSDQAFVLNALAAGAPIRLGGDLINDDQEELDQYDDDKGDDDNN
jgi:hypothetical protein